MKRMSMKILVATVAAICLTSAKADTWTDEDGHVWTYTVKDGVATVGGGSYTAPAVHRSTLGDIVIPSTLGGCPVTTIAQCAFQECTNIKSIIIPDSVTTIKRSAFAYCTSLRLLKFGNGISSIRYDTGSTGQIVGTENGVVNIITYDNPFKGCSALAGLEFGTNTMSYLKMSNFSDSKRLSYMYFPGRFPTTVNGTMPGMESRAIYVTHDAYPNGLPQTTLAGVPLKFLEDGLPSEGKSWDLAFVYLTNSDGSLKRPSFFLSSETDSTTSCDRFFEGDPIYCGYSCMDIWGVADITNSFTNVLYVSGRDEVAFSVNDNESSNGSIHFYYWDSQLFSNLQNLPLGEYKATLVLNDTRAIQETSYANNTNTITFSVVPSTTVTFVSEGNTVAERKYETGAAYGSFPTNPVLPGFRFVGWFTDEEGGDVVTATSVVPSLPTTLYAHWKVAVSETVTVGGTLATGTTTWLCGNLYKVTSNLTVPSGATLTLEPGVIVKFAAGKSLTVNSGGTLSAIGTRALPIVFTSIKDDDNGGDTNGDGTKTAPSGGDWYGITVYGNANFVHSTMMYAGPNNECGIIATRENGILKMDSCTVAHAKYDGIWNWGGSVSVKNTIVMDTGWASAPFRGSKNEYINCVFYENNVGLCYWPKWSGNPIYRNCAFVQCLNGWCETGSGLYGDPPSAVSVANCLFYNSQGVGLLQACGRVGKAGNIWGDPLFANPTRNDFRIAATSPCVDAGDGSAAPETDYYGKPRMNVEAVRPTGSASANGAVPDIGIYEVPGDGNIPAPDLTIVSVTAPEALTVGETVEISWTVKNIGEEPADGAWRDEIEIVAANGQVFSTGTSTARAQIKPSASANFKATVTVPAAPEGTVQVRVTANKYQDLFEAMKSENNVGSAAATLAVPTLAVPTDGTATTVTLNGDSDVGFALDGGGAVATQGGVLVIRGAGELDAWLGNGSIAAKDNAIRTAVKIADDTWLLQVPAGSEPRVTVQNAGDSEVGALLSLEVGGFFLLDTGKMSAANSGVVSVPFAGNGFNDSLVCWLERGGRQVDASDLKMESGVSAVAMFDVTGCEAGDWILHVKKGANEASATLLTLVESRIGAKWFCKVNVASTIRSGRVYTGSVEYGNSGDTAMPAPYLHLTANSGTLIRLTEADAWTDSIELLAISSSYPASSLKPGESGKVEFFYKTTARNVKVTCDITRASAKAFPWDTNAAYMRPSWATDEMWALALATMKANIGTTWDGFLQRMRDNADYLMKIGRTKARLDRMWQMVINEALGTDWAIQTLARGTDLARSGRGMGLSFSRTYGSSMSSRLRTGVFGYGWQGNYSHYAELVDSTTLAIHLPSGSTYQFTKVSGSWTSEDARDKTKLVESGTAYTLTYVDGTVQTIAKSNMRTSSICDNQGNTLTFTYNGNLLTKVEHTDGQSLAFTYSGNKVTSVSDDQGRTVNYGYTGDMLTSVTAFNGLVTRYAYHAADGTALSRALTQITYPDRTTKDYTYDTVGRVATVSVNGNQFTTEIVRTGGGSYAVVAPNGGVTEVTVGAKGNVPKIVNALGQTVKQKYSDTGLLESVIAPSGKRNKMSYNKDGQLVAAVSASGAETTFAYEPDFDNLASVTDAKGHAISYGYDELGRGNSISYVDGSSSSLEYGERGDVVKSTNRRGESITYEYDAEGNLTKKTWPNGRTFTMAYDEKGNVTNATDSVTGAVTMEYDVNERLTRIVYPKGRGFTYTYDAVGRMTERTALRSDGAPAVADTQRFTYDSLGRLATVTDGDGTPYLTNAYDPTTGWLVTQTYGNGTVVSNAYDILGRTVGIYHLQPSTFQPLTYFEYVYDVDGKCISQTTAEGTESYTYDADGQLIGVTYPDGTSESFTYDAVGNRITHTGTTGVSPVAYTVNNLNQYTQIDDITLEYDLDGNMTRNGDTLYYYDPLNRLVAVTNETKNIHWSCEYDVFGNRVSVTDNGTTTEKVFVQGSLPSVSTEYVNGSLSKRHVLVGAVRVADLTGTTGVSPVALSARYYHSDILGSARLLTDGTGVTKGTRSFKAFGETRKSDGEMTDAGYVGMFGIETDSNGLLFMRNRYYDAGMGRFMQRDPIGLNGGDINELRYCANAPTEDIDLYGTDSSPVCSSKTGRTARDAAAICGQEVNGKSIRDNIEYCGPVCEYDDGSGYVGTYTTGTKDMCTPAKASCPEGSHPVANWHTHGRYDRRYDNENFSRDDKNLAKKTGMDNYLITPSNHFKQVSPGGKVTKYGKLRIR